jgi:tRNA dimethylallyltransferase
MPAVEADLARIRPEPDDVARLGGDCGERAPRPFGDAMIEGRAWRGGEDEDVDVGHRREDNTTGTGTDSSAAKGEKDAGPVLVVAGPTASGKSALALAIAEAFGGTVVNADSMQVYRELPVLTAQPMPADRARAPHVLYGVLSASERCTVGRWREMALVEIARARASGRLPIVTGGTGLYLKALMQGLASVPDVPPQVRAETVALHEQLGAERFHAALAQLDPAMAARLAPRDTQRVRRAYEVIVATGRSLADYQAETAATDGAFVTVLLMPPRASLNAACDARCQTMIEAGAVEEVRVLLSQDLPPDLPAMKALGVRELARHLRGELDLEAAVALLQRSTRQYAKRQYTWFRHQMTGAQVWDAQFSERIKAEIFSFIRKTVDRVGTGV